MSISTESFQEKVVKCDICGRDVVREANPTYSGIAKKAKHFCAQHVREESVWNILQELQLTATEAEFWKEIKKI